MGRKKGSRNYPRAFKRQVVAEALPAPSIAAVAHGHELNANMVHLWCKDDRFRDELLNSEILYSLREAKILIEQWRVYYNTVRPHSALGYRPPAPESIVPMDQRPMMH